MRFLITGGAGFIRSNAARRLSEALAAACSTGSGKTANFLSRKGIRVAAE